MVRMDDSVITQQIGPKLLHRKYDAQQLFLCSGVIPLRSQQGSANKSYGFVFPSLSSWYNSVPKAVLLASVCK